MIDYLFSNNDTILDNILSAAIGGVLVSMFFLFGTKIIKEIKTILYIIKNNTLEIPIIHLLKIELKIIHNKKISVKDSLFLMNLPEERLTKRQKIQVEKDKKILAEGTKRVITEIK